MNFSSRYRLNSFVQEITQHFCEVTHKIKQFLRRHLSNNLARSVIDYFDDLGSRGLVSFELNRPLSEFHHNFNGIDGFIDFSFDVFWTLVRRSG